MKKIAVIVGLAVLAMLCACGKSSNVSTQSAASGAPAASSGSVLVPSGTQFRGKLQQEISTKKSHDGDTFTIVRSDGAIIDGHLTGVSPARLGKKPALTVVMLSQQMKTDVDVKPGTVIAVKFVSDAVAQTSPAPSAQ